MDVAPSPHGGRSPPCIRRASARAGAPARAAPRSRSRGSAHRRWGCRRWRRASGSMEWPRLVLAAQSTLKPTAMASPRRPSLRVHLKPHHKLWLNWDGAFLMGPRYLRFLDAVDRTGTIRAAGREVGWSYRTCLNRIREMERVLGAKVLATTRGGALRLSDVAFRKILPR